MTKDLYIKDSLVVKSRTDNLSAIREFISAMAKQAGFDDATVEKIALSVDEACTNIIKHAYKNSPEGDIIIKAKSANYKFIIEIVDYGSVFDPQLIPEPDIRKYYKEKKVGGLGMFLMKKLMDEVHYTRTAGKENRVALVKYLNK